MARNLLGPQSDSKIAVHQVVLKKIILDRLTFITQTKNEVFEPKEGVCPHDMPYDRLSADHDHRLGSKLCFFPEPRPQPTAENNRFHLFTFPAFHSSNQNDRVLPVGSCSPAS